MITHNKIYDIIIIGGGSAGLFCSATFPRSTQGLIIEKTSRVGTKLLMSGSGQCNLTHGGSIKDFVTHYGENGKKIRTCLYKQNNQNLMNFFEENGLSLVVRDDEKVFPRSLSSKDVLNILVKRTEKNGFQIKTNEEIKKVWKEENFFFIETNKSLYKCRYLVIATGGKSYPTTGSNGNFFHIIEKQLALKVTELKPCLTPVFVENYPYSSLSGISFQDIQLTLYRNGKKIKSKTGDLLFTHRNFSGPLILNFSRELCPGDEIMINYLGIHDTKEIIGKINTSSCGHNNNNINVICDTFNLPKRFITLINERVNGNIKELIKLLVSDKFTISGLAGFNNAMATNGGVSLEEINLTTMECNTISNLFFIGEVLNIDGDTGGYNLQFAYSSAMTVNQTINRGGKNDY